METTDAAALPLTTRLLMHPGYLEALLEGFAGLDSAQAALQKVGTAAKDSGVDRVLVNCLGILGQTAPYDHAALGMTLGRELSGRRCALLTYASRIKGVMGAAALEAGADYRAFSVREEALEWLCR